MSDSLAIRNGRLLDPGAGLDAVGDLLIADGKITSLLARDAQAEWVFDATGLLVTPGLVDIHVHLREPGKEEAETVATGAAAALAGGFTTIVCMPNTSPPLDNPDAVEKVRRLARESGAAKVEVTACITSERRGRSLVDMAALADLDVVGFSDDGACVADAALMFEAMRRARTCDLPIIDHCEDAAVSGKGVIHAGGMAEFLGVPGIPSESESLMVVRDLALAHLTGARVHIQHVSASESVELIRAAKKAGINVTAEVTPHHLILTEESLRAGDANFKMNPPLRSAKDMAALRAGLKDGTIDCIATDHAPHTAREKALGLERAPFGVIGLESALAVLWTELVATGEFSAAQLIGLLSTNPARVLRLACGTLAVNAPADVTIIDPECRWVIDPNDFRSKSRNCPFGGRRVTGKAVAVAIGGRMVIGAERVERRGGGR